MRVELYDVNEIAGRLVTIDVGATKLLAYRVDFILVSFRAGDSAGQHCDLEDYDRIRVDHSRQYSGRPGRRSCGKGGTARLTLSYPFGYAFHIAKWV